MENRVQTVFRDFNALSKRDLAEMVNKQGETINRLQLEVVKLSRMLTAIARQPDALHQENGITTVAGDAYLEVPQGAVLRIVPHEAQNTLELVVQEPSRILQPGSHGLVGSPAQLRYTRKDGIVEVH